MATSFNEDMRFLFVGDGIADGGWATDSESVGHGFVRVIRDFLRAKHAPLAPVILNRAHAQRRLTELAAAWEQEVIAERPDLISIHIDVGDPGKHDSAAAPEASLDQFRAVYRHVLTQTTERLPRARLVLCEPAAIWSNTSVESDKALRAYREALNEIAKEFHAQAKVPFHSAMIFARRSRPDIIWDTPDHQLTSSGHTVLAYTWLEEMGIDKRPFT